MRNNDIDLFIGAQSRGQVSGMRPHSNCCCCCTVRRILVAYSSVTAIILASMVRIALGTRCDGAVTGRGLAMAAARLTMTGTIPDVVKLPATLTCLIVLARPSILDAPRVARLVPRPSVATHRLGFPRAPSLALASTAARLSMLAIAAAAARLVVAMIVRSVVFVAHRGWQGSPRQGRKSKGKEEDNDEHSLVVHPEDDGRA